MRYFFDLVDGEKSTDLGGAEYPTDEAARQEAILRALDNRETRQLQATKPTAASACATKTAAQFAKWLFKVSGHLPRAPSSDRRALKPEGGQGEANRRRQFPRAGPCRLSFERSEAFIFANYP
jgi:hypothetical protein